MQKLLERLAIGYLRRRGYQAIPYGFKGMVVGGNAVATEEPTGSKDISVWTVAFPFDTGRYVWGLNGSLVLHCE